LARDPRFLNYPITQLLDYPMPVSETSIPAAALRRISDELALANRLAAERYPGDSPSRQPVHTVYGGAHLFAADIAQKLGAAALKALDEYAPDAAALAGIFEMSAALAARIRPRIVDKLEREPVEDFRIDFEDGFGMRPEEEEDQCAREAAEQVAKGFSSHLLPPGIGIRIKTLSEELKARGLRTFDLFLTRLLERTDGRLPSGFVVTLPKLTSPAQVSALAAACDELERARGLARGVLAIELMVETPQSIFSAEGDVALPRLVAAGGGRIIGAHFGTYDYTAGLSITAAHQHMAHPACDFAKHVMQVALAGTPVRLSDGATNIMPVGPHRAPPGKVLSASERHENAEVVHRAWRLHAEHIRHSLVGGFYQGWDLHPAQLPSRYAAVYAFFLEGMDQASDRLRNFVAKAAQATLVGEVFDDAATGQGLLNYFLRAVNCGAMTEDEAIERSGLTLDELRGRSFVKILANRRRS
jgi:citrate lyase beta subunit